MGREPLRVSGAWTFRGTRIPIAALCQNLEDGASLAELTVLWVRSRLGVCCYKPKEISIDTLKESLQENFLARLRSLCVLVGLLFVAVSGSIASAHPDHQQLGQQAPQHDHDHGDQH